MGGADDDAAAGGVCAFLGKGTGTGLFVLTDWREGKGHERFVEAVRKRVA